LIVHVEIELLTALNNKDKEQMYHAATMITDDVESIIINEPSKDGKEVAVEFSIKKARQADVVDSIGRAFRRNVENNIGTTISFTNKSGRKKQRKFTPKQGQYLSLPPHFLS